MKSTDTEFRPKASSVRVIGERVFIHLANGRRISFPWARNAKLSAASPEARANVELICDGTGLHWPLLDEDLSVIGIVEGRFGADRVR